MRSRPKGAAHLGRAAAGSAYLASKTSSQKKDLGGRKGLSGVPKKNSCNCLGIIILCVNGINLGCFVGCIEGRKKDRIPVSHFFLSFLVPISWKIWTMLKGCSTKNCWKSCYEAD